MLNLFKQNQITRNAYCLLADNTYNSLDTEFRRVYNENYCTHDLTFLEKLEYIYILGIYGLRK